MRFGLHPSTEIVRSPHPIVTIWAMNSGEQDVAPIENWCGEDALVFRPYLDVEVARCRRVVQHSCSRSPEVGGLARRPRPPLPTIRNSISPAIWRAHWLRPRAGYRPSLTRIMGYNFQCCGFGDQPVVQSYP